MSDIKTTVDSVLMSSMISAHWGFINDFNMKDPKKAMLVYKKQINQMVECFAPFLKELTSDEFIALVRRNFGEVTADGFERILKEKI